MSIYNMRQNIKNIKQISGLSKDQKSIIEISLNNNIVTNENLNNQIISNNIRISNYKEKIAEYNAKMQQKNYQLHVAAYQNNKNLDISISTYYKNNEQLRNISAQLNIGIDNVPYKRDIGNKYSIYRTDYAVDGSNGKEWFDIYGIRTFQDAPTFQKLYRFPSGNSYGPNYQTVTNGTISNLSANIGQCQYFFVIDLLQKFEYPKYSYIKPTYIEEGWDKVSSSMPSSMIQYLDEQTKERYINFENKKREIKFITNDKKQQLKNFSINLNNYFLRANSIIHKYTLNVKNSYTIPISKFIDEQYINISIQEQRPMDNPWCYIVKQKYSVYVDGFPPKKDGPYKSGGYGQNFQYKKEIFQEI